MKQILKSMFGRVIGLDDADLLVAAKGLRIGDYPRQFLQPSPYHNSQFDDFLGQTLSGQWGVAKGSDGSTANFAITAALSGSAKGTTGAGSTLTMAVNGVQISGALNYQANSDRLEFGTRVQLGAITTVALFVGLTNQTASLQMPINGSGTGDGFTVAANDCVGLLFDTAMTDAKWWAASAKAGTATAGINSGSAPVAATYDDVFISVDASGNASFFLNGVSLGTIANAVTKTVPLAPVIAGFRRSAASTTVIADYLYAANNRV
jgi:hypothetical protein